MVHSNGRSGRKLCLKRNLPKSNHHTAEGIPLIPLAPPKLHCTSTCCIHTIKIPVSFLTFLQLTPINACDQWTTFDHLNCTRTLAVAPIATHPIILLLHKWHLDFPQQTSTRNWTSETLLHYTSQSGENPFRNDANTWTKYKWILCLVTPLS